MSQQLTMADFAAMSELATARRMAMQNMFGGTKLVFGSMEKVQTGKKLIQSGKKIKKSADKVKNASHSGGGFAAQQLQTVAKEFIKTCADVDNIEDIITALTSEVLNELISEIIPFISVAASALKTAKAAKAVATDAKSLYHSREYKSGFRGGDPLAAAEAVITLIKRNLAKDSINLARHSAATGGKIAGLVLDGGTATTAAIGMCNAVAALGMELFTLGLEIKEMQAGNKRLSSPATLDFTVFNECPILGCYMLTCADTSTVANFFIADIGMPGWMDKVEEIKKKKMDPLLKLATKDIEKSRLQLSGLQSDKGTHTKKGFFAKKKSNALKYLSLA
ncbi:hypothetical protein [Paraglaciecola arctica]|uniref:Uncharacterized protein n=1 Tax=Paraglaciecola arctica BSs20135 TaxID=493475 RepID=K6XC17_9ALTE|nr:hypothetical protein [Paraglaciecola arctica]GAC18179.1 hypothetical protein GARC_1199 [Paraglaciecola arctica BSs20135]